MNAADNFALSEEITRNITQALIEDIGEIDLTAELIPPEIVASATVITREDAILCGTAWFDACFKKLDPAVAITWNFTDGNRVASGEILSEIRGPARALLAGERTALNFLQTLSAVATKTRQFVEAATGTRALIVDTRKTIPGLRLAQKYAVQCGGGTNHRKGLFDAILIKENHILAAGSIAEAMLAADRLKAQYSNQCKFVQVEVETLAELRQALDSGAKMVLLDNMSLETITEAVKMNNGRALLEASGNVTLETVRPIAASGVDRISIGSLTKDIKAVDISMRFHNS